MTPFDVHRRCDEVLRNEVLRNEVLRNEVVLRTNEVATKGRKC